MIKSTEPASANPLGSGPLKTEGMAPQPKPEDSRAASATAAGASPPSGKTLGSPGRTVAERKKQYLVTGRRPQGMEMMGLQPLELSMLEQTLRASPDVEVVDTVGPKNVMGMLASGLSDAQGVVVAKMSDQKAGILHQQAQGRLIVERDQALNLLDLPFQQPQMVAGFSTSTGTVLAAAFVVLGKDNTPLPDAEVYLFGSLLPATGVTDAQGKATLTLFGERAESIRGLYVKPKSDYWSFYQTSPDIAADEANVVVLRPLADWPSLPNFPKQQLFGWGQKAMRLDQLPGNYRGQGIKVAIVDSGAATTHDDLRDIRFGFDILNKKSSPNTWNVDTIAHGSHCAGVIAGEESGVGIRGFCPDAEIHVCKLFPGGQVSQLIDALEYCVEKQIDVVNLSLGGIEPSEALEQQILRAKRAGVACIVAAGNSGGRVQYPASSPNVLAVAAIGRINEFPPDSYHSQTITSFLDANGFFSPKFTCYGPEIAVCAPGVAIPSSVPSNNYAAWDGTSMAAPHVTGLAALVMAHHPEFQSVFTARNAERVERLFQIIKLSARRLNLGDATRTGFGLPDAPAAVGLQPLAGVSLASGLNAAATPQNAIGSLVGAPAAVSMQNAAAGAFNPYVAAYFAQMAPQAWSGQSLQPMGGTLTGMAGMEPAYGAAYMLSSFPFSSQGGMQGLAFGMPPPGFSPVGWRG